MMEAYFSIRRQGKRRIVLATRGRLLASDPEMFAVIVGGAGN